MAADFTSLSAVASTEEPAQKPTDVRVCSICEDTGAVAKHYGGIACSGCRGFFRRTVRFNRHYICAHDSKCDTRKGMRNQCRSCRYEKALKAGLDPKLVHSDRACDKPAGGRKRLPSTAQPELPTSSPEEAASSRAIVKQEPLDHLYSDRATNLGLIASKLMFKADGLPLGFKRILDNFQRADYRSVQQFFILAGRLCDSFIDNQHDHLLARPSFYNFNLNATVEDAFLLEPRVVSDRTVIDWNPRFFLTGDDFKKVWCRISVYYCDFVSHVPELNLLDDADKLALIIGRCVPSVWMIFAYQAYMCKTRDAFVLTGGSFYPMDNPSEYRDPLLSKFLGEMCSWVWTEVVEIAREWKFSEAEFALLRVLCFMTPVPALSPRGKEIVREAQSFYQSVLSDLVLSNVGAGGFGRFTERLGALLMTLPALERTTQIEDDHLTMLTLGNHGQFAGSLTHEFYIRRRGRC
ncbi:hypothetical protein M3Y99_01825700 [Aphelenchoides fujianensis]|nr:hypothetical protein M3Y99_01825700 [Aphelenchoides fujianensis]